MPSFTLVSSSVDPVALVMGVLALSILLLAVFIIASASFFKRVVLSQGEAERMREEARKEAEAIRAHAKADAMRLVEDAHKAAEKMVQEIAFLDERGKKEVADQLQVLLHREGERMRGATDAFLSGYAQASDSAKAMWKRTAEEVSKTTERSIQGLLADLQKAADKEIGVMGEKLGEELKEWRKKVTQEFEENRKELGMYRKEVMQKAEASAEQAVSVIAKEVLGRALSSEDHEKLILRALEEARKTGLFQ